MEMVKQGSTLLVSGPIDTDDHWMAAARSQSLGVTASTTPVAQEEALMIAAAEYRLGYREDKLQRLDKAVIEGNSPAKVLLIHVGKGTVLWSPLPVELAEDVEATVALYRLALRTAEVAGVCSAESIDRSVLLLPAVYDEAVLFALVSEGSENVRCTFTHHESSRTFTVDVPARRTAMAFVRRKDGEIISQFPSPS
jgi:hypothetical protein